MMLGAGIARLPVFDIISLGDDSFSRQPLRLAGC
jgi:hypothetical protein